MQVRGGHDLLRRLQLSPTRWVLLINVLDSAQKELYMGVDISTNFLQPVLLRNKHRFRRICRVLLVHHGCVLLACLVLNNCIRVCRLVWECFVLGALTGKLHLLEWIHFLLLVLHATCCVNHSRLRLKLVHASLALF